MVATVFQTLAVNRSGAAVRVVIGTMLGVVVTAALLWTMQYMIETTDRELNEGGSTHLVDFVRLKRDETIHRRELKPTKPPPPASPPPQPASPQLESLDPSVGTIAIPPAPVETTIAMSSGFNLAVGEGDYLPIVKVAPIYPQRALIRGIEGYCIVQFTVTRLGTTRDPFVIEGACTDALFRDPSIQAALKFKYKPRVVDGQAVEVPGVRNKFTYVIENEAPKQG
jgi:protein TonB